MDKLSEEQKKRMMEAGQAAVNMSHGVKNILQAMRSGRDVMDLALDLRDIDMAILRLVDGLPDGVESLPLAATDGTIGHTT